MIRKNKGTVILTSLMCLLPVAAGLLLWDRLPEQIPTHWNYSGEVDGWSGKAFAVLALPLFIFAVHWVCLGATALDPKGRNISGKVVGLVLWICPVISVTTAGMMYGTALGARVNVSLLMPALVGAMFIVIGNYLPKCRQNYTVGIKLPWTLHDEGNWTATHRFGGRVWVAGGIVTLTAALVGAQWVLLAALPVLALAPVVYSYMYYRRNK